MSIGVAPAVSLVVPANFIRAVRESGYVSLATALAELVDNAIQAAATRVDITIVKPSPADPPDIVVTDNGTGMTRRELESCLRFGGTARFDDRCSFGRFGIGLPAASLSQTRQVVVAAWQSGRRALEVTLDVDAIATGVSADLHARETNLHMPGTSGCVIAWRRCDRIEYQRLAWLERSLHRDLGRMYRRFLGGDLRLTVNGKQVKPLDPMLLTGPIEGRTATLAFEPMRYEIAASDGLTSFVTVRFSFLPVHAWHQLDNLAKRRAGIVGGGGVSILRAGREIAFGWHLMGGKRKENYDDWWRCEIEFDPALDEHFGITINKQGIRPSAQLREAIEPELESVARMLNSRVRQAFEDVKFREATQESCRIAEAADRNLPVLPRGKRRGQGGALTYRLTSEPLASGEMFETHLEHSTLRVTLNTDHPAFVALYRPLQALGDESGASSLRTAIELLVLSLARSSVTTPSGLRDVLTSWSSTYAKMLQQT